MKRIILIFSLMIMLISCSGTNSTLKLATGSTGGTYYPLGSALAELLSDESDTRVNAYTGNASVSNTRMIDQQVVDMALVQSNVAAWAISGTGAFADDKIESISGLGSLYSEVIQVIVRKDAEIGNFYGLRNKRVSLGKKDSGNYFDANNLLIAHDMTIESVEPYYLTFSEAMEAMSVGELDAVFVTAGIPTTSITLMSSKVPVDMLSIDENILNKMIEEQPFYTREVVPAFTYIGQKTNRITLSTRALWICHSDLDEEVVYDMVKSFWLNYEDLKDVHQSMLSLSQEDALKGMSIPLHPGAIKYYEELGIEIQD
jgi:TRAP transporter TAXI family solute receptor